MTWGAAVRQLTRPRRGRRKYGDNVTKGEITMVHFG